MNTEIERATRILEATLKTTAKEEDGNLLVHTYQDVEPHLEYAAKCRRVDAEDRGAFGKRAEFRRTMSVPMNIMMNIASKLGIPMGQIFDKEHQKRITRELKSSEYAYFRVTTDRAI